VEEALCGIVQPILGSAKRASYSPGGLPDSRRWLEDGVYVLGRLPGLEYQPHDGAATEAHLTDHVTRAQLRVEGEEQLSDSIGTEHGQALSRKLPNTKILRLRKCVGDSTNAVALRFSMPETNHGSGNGGSRRGIP